MFRFIIYSFLIYIAIYYLARKSPWLIHWIGKLPGDISVRQDKNNILYIPFSSMLLLSLSLALLITLLKHIF